MSPIQHIPAVCGDREGFFSRIVTRLNTIWVSATYPFASKGRKLSLHYTSDISRSLARRIRLGKRVAIGKHSWLSVGLDGTPGINIVIEDGCRIAARCTISAKNLIHLERNVVVGSDVLIIDRNHAYEDVSIPTTRQGFTPGGTIRIGEGCRIGDGVAVICDKGELVLGRNCILAPGAVVTRSFPPDSLISGNPARAQRSGTSGISVEKDPVGALEGN